MSVVSLRLPENLKALATAQAEACGMSLDEYVATTLAARLRDHAEAERYFRERAARAVPGRARVILDKAGRDNPPRPDDRIEDDGTAAG